MFCFVQCRKFLQTFYICSYQAIDTETKQFIEQETAKALESTEPDFKEIANDIYITNVPLPTRSTNIYEPFVHEVNA